MRKDLVEAVLNAASDHLFEDVLYTHSPAGPVLVGKAIAGVEKVSERFELLGNELRGVTHTVRAIKSKFPNLSRGDVIDDGTAYQVLDWQPPENGDGRFEIDISLKKL